MTHPRHRFRRSLLSTLAVSAGTALALASPSTAQSNAFYGFSIVSAKGTYTWTAAGTGASARCPVDADFNPIPCDGSVDQRYTVKWKLRRSPVIIGIQPRQIVTLPAEISPNAFTDRLSVLSYVQPYDATWAFTSTGTDGLGATATCDEKGTITAGEGVLGFFVAKKGKSLHFATQMQGSGNPDDLLNPLSSNRPCNDADGTLDITDSKPETFSAIPLSRITKTTRGKRLKITFTSSVPVTARTVLGGDSSQTRVIGTAKKSTTLILKRK